MFAPRTSGARAAVGAVSLVTALLAGLGLTGCSSGSPAGSSGAPAPSNGALSLSDRVVPDELAGLSSPKGVQEAKTAEDYANLLNPDDAEDPDLADKRKLDVDLAKENGFVGAAVKNYGTTDAGTGTSVALQLGSPEQAKAYEQQVYDEEFAPDLPAEAVKGAVAGSAQSHTVIASAEDQGLTNTLALASFVDGPFVYVLSAGGSDPTVTKDSARGLLDEANKLYTKVKDRPAP
jgi:hypothetical protein